MGEYFPERIVIYKNICKYAIYMYNNIQIYICIIWNYEKEITTLQESQSAHDTQCATPTIN
jgi:hypothetical protein